MDNKPDKPKSVGNILGIAIIQLEFDLFSLIKNKIKERFCIGSIERTTHRDLS